MTLLPQTGTQQFTTFAWIHLESPEYSPQEVKVKDPNSLEVVEWCIAQTDLQVSRMMAESYATDSKTFFFSDG